MTGMKQTRIEYKAWIELPDVKPDTKPEQVDEHEVYFVEASR